MGSRGARSSPSCELSTGVGGGYAAESKRSDESMQTFSLSSHSPYIIGTTNQPVKMTPNHGLHLSFR